MRKLLFSLLLAATLGCSSAFAQQTLPTLPAGTTPYAGTDLFYCTIGGVSSKCAFSGILGAATSKTVAAPAATSVVTPGVMMGLAGTITPVKTGNVVLTINGTWAQAVVGIVCTAALRTGTGTAPANGVAATGTQQGLSINMKETVAANQFPFSLTALVTGLTVGTAVWLDVSLFTSTVSDACTMTNLTITAVEQ